MRHAILCYDFQILLNFLWRRTWRNEKVRPYCNSQISLLMSVYNLLNLLLLQRTGCYIEVSILKIFLLFQKIWKQRMPSWINELYYFQEEIFWSCNNAVIQNEWVNRKWCFLWENHYPRTEIMPRSQLIYLVWKQ